MAAQQAAWWTHLTALVRARPLPPPPPPPPCSSSESGDSGSEEDLALASPISPPCLASRSPQPAAVAVAEDLAVEGRLEQLRAQLARSSLFRSAALRHRIACSDRRLQGRLESMVKIEHESDDGALEPQTQTQQTLRRAAEGFATLGQVATRLLPSRKDSGVKQEEHSGATEVAVSTHRRGSRRLQQRAARRRRRSLQTPSAPSSSGQGIIPRWRSKGKGEGKGKGKGKRKKCKHLPLPKQKRRRQRRPYRERTPSPATMRTRIAAKRVAVSPPRPSRPTSRARPSCKLGREVTIRLSL